MNEIVGALREVRQSAARMAPFTVVDGRRDGGLSATPAERGGGPVDVEELRDNEIARLLTENARLNERVVFLLKVIEREHALKAELAARQATIDKDQDAVIRQVRMAVETELRPLLQVLLRLLEKRRTHDSASTPKAGVGQAAEPDAETDSANWIIDADAAKL